MIAPADESRCELCGESSGGHTHRLHERSTREAGRRIHYVVGGVRGGIAVFHPAADPEKLHRTDAAALAMQLKVDLTELVGQRFSCWVAPAEYGVFRSDFQRVES